MRRYVNGVLNDGGQDMADKAKQRECDDELIALLLLAVAVQLEGRHDKPART